MISEEQRELIDVDTKIAKVLLVLADAIKPMRQSEIVALSGLRSDEVNTSIRKILKSRYCEVTADGRYPKLYTLKKMNCSIAEYQQRSRMNKVAMGGMAFTENKTNLLAEVFL